MELGSSMTTNPIHTGSRRVSEAYLRSKELARRREEENPSGYLPGERAHRLKSIGPRTLFVTLLLFVTGCILFIIGGVYYWSSTGEEQNGQGKDILIVSGILLLPGTYGTVVLLGSFLKWKGSLHTLSSTSSALAYAMTSILFIYDLLTV